MKKLKILFQEPFVPRDVTYGKFFKGTGNNTFPYGVACIASYIKDHGYDVSYIEPAIEMITYDEYINFIKTNKFDLIGIGSTTLQVEYAMESFRFIKQNFPHIITVLGGVHATLMPQETLNYIDVIDYLILGEGEKPFLQLIDYLTHGKKELIKGIDGICFKENGSVIINPPNSKNYLLPEEIPIPLFDIFPMKKYVPHITLAKVFPSYSVVASRGCPFQCAFCNAADTLGRKVRYKPVDTLLEEIKILKDKHGARGIMFLDSTFTVNKKWVKEFCYKYLKLEMKLPWACNSRVDTIDREILELMKEAGCWTIVYGLESANQKSLDLINKGTTVEQNTHAVKLSLELDYNVYTSYIICLPGETEEDVLNTIIYAKNLGNHLSGFYLPVPFPKTKLWDICREKGGLRADPQWSDFNVLDYSNPVYINPLIGKGKMLKLYRKAFMSFYSNPVVWFRNFKEIVLMKQHPSKYWMGLRGLLGIIFTKAQKRE